MDRSQLIYQMQVFDRPLSVAAANYAHCAFDRWSPFTIDTFAIYRETISNVPEVANLDPHTFEERWNTSEAPLTTAIPLPADRWIWTKRSVTGKTLTQLCDEIVQSIKKRLDAWTNAHGAKQVANNPYGEFYEYAKGITPQWLWFHPRNAEQRSEAILRRAHGHATADVVAAWRALESPDPNGRPNVWSLGPIKFGVSDTLMLPEPELSPNAAGSVRIAPRGAINADGTPQVLKSEPVWMTTLRQGLNTIEDLTNSLKISTDAAEAIRADIYGGCARIAIVQQVICAFWLQALSMRGGGWQESKNQKQAAAADALLKQGRALLDSSEMTDLLTDPVKAVDPLFERERWVTRDALMQATHANPSLAAAIDVMHQMPDRVCDPQQEGVVFEERTNQVFTAAADQLARAQKGWDVDAEFRKQLQLLKSSPPAPTEGNPVEKFISGAMGNAKKGAYAKTLIGKIIEAHAISGLVQAGGDMAKWKQIYQDMSEYLQLADLMSKDEIAKFEKATAAEVDKIKEIEELVGQQQVAIAMGQKPIGNTKDEGGQKLIDSKKAEAKVRFDAAKSATKLASLKWVGPFAILNVMALLSTVSHPDHNAPKYAASLLGATVKAQVSIMEVLDALSPGGPVGKLLKTWTISKGSELFGAAAGLVGGYFTVADGLEKHNDKAVVAGGAQMAGAVVTAAAVLLKLHPYVRVAGQIITLVASLVDTSTPTEPAAHVYVMTLLNRVVKIRKTEPGATKTYEFDGDPGFFGNFHRALQQMPRLLGFYGGYWTDVESETLGWAALQPFFPSSNRFGGEALVRSQPIGMLQSMGLTKAEFAHADTLVDFLIEK